METLRGWTVPFQPTWSSTKKHIKQESSKDGPKCVVASLSAKVGGVMEAKAPGQLPRDEKQVTNHETYLSKESFVILILSA